MPFTPARHQLMVDAQLIKHPRHNEIHQIIDAFRMMVETRIGGEYHGTGIRKFQHVFKMQHRKRRFTGDQYQSTLFLDHHVGRAFDQAV